MSAFFCIMKRVSRAMSTGLIGALLAAGCAGPSGPVRIVPAQYEKLTGKVRTVAVCSFENATKENKGSISSAASVFVNPVVDQFPDAGEALKGSVIDILSGKDFPRTNGLRERADRDVATPYEFGPDGAEGGPTPFRAVEAAGVLGPKASVQEITPAAASSGAQAVLGGRVELLVVQFAPGAAGSSSGSVVATYSTGTIQCKVVFTLYDAHTGNHLMERTVSTSALFSHGAYSQPVDKLQYAQACVEKVLYNAAWQFLSDLIPHFRRLGDAEGVGGSREPVRFEGATD